MGLLRKMCRQIWFFSGEYWMIPVQLVYLAVELNWVLWCTYQIVLWKTGCIVTCLFSEVYLQYPVQTIERSNSSSTRYTRYTRFDSSMD